MTTLVNNARAARTRARACIERWFVLSLALACGQPLLARADDSASAESVQKLNEAYQRKRAHDLPGAEQAFRDAKRAGADPQLISLELGYLAATQQRAEQARASFTRAERGPDPKLRAEAHRQLAALALPTPTESAAPQPSPPDTPLVASEPVTAPYAVTEQDAAHRSLGAAYRAKAEGKYPAAIAAFEEARKQGASSQMIDLELGYTAAAQGDAAAARAAFQRAAAGPDSGLSSEAQRQLAAASGVTGATLGPWLDVYLDAFAWSRQLGSTKLEDLVPTLRVRGLYQFTDAPALEVYVVAQAVRDLASRGASGGNLPVIYADNKLLLGGGAQLRMFQGRLGVYTQAAAAFDLVAEDQDAVALDLRVGAFADLRTQNCLPEPGGGAELALWWCNETYADAVYVNRYDHNIVAFARGRSIVGFARTHALAFHLAFEGRVAKDKNNDYYNNFVDVGVGPLVRLLTPLRVDFMLGVHAGTYFGLSNRDPAPASLGYLDLRALIATYWALGH